MTNPKEVIIKMVLDTWNAQIQNANKILAAITDDQLLHEIAPSKNRGVYLLGHLAAVNDKMLPLLGFGEPLNVPLHKTFLELADKVVAEIPSVTQLKAYWTATTAELTKHFNNMQADEWFQKHSSVSEEDFIKEPHRNKLNIIITRTNHLSYHLGQLALLKK